LTFLNKATIFKTEQHTLKYLQAAFYQTQKDNKPD